MPYIPLSPLDTPVTTEGHTARRGFRSRPPATSLPPDIARYAQNMRFEGDREQPRAGSQAVATDLVLVNPPVILDVALPAEVIVNSITRSGTTATVTTRTNHGYTTGDIIGIENAVQPEYNGDFAITVTGVKTFTYQVAGSPATPATIVANFNTLLIGPGVNNGDFVVPGDGSIDTIGHGDGRLLGSWIESWTPGYSSLVQDTVNTYNGKPSAKFIVDSLASTVRMLQQPPMAGGRPYRLEFVAKTDASMAGVKVTGPGNPNPIILTPTWTQYFFEAFISNSDLRFENNPGEISKNFWIADVQLRESTIVCAKGPRIFEVYADHVRAGCVFTDDDNSEHILVASNADAFVVTEGQASARIDYPAGEIIGDDDKTDLQAANGYVYLMRGRSAGPVLAVTAITRAGATVTVQTATAHNLATNDWVRLPNQSAEDYRGVWQITAVDATHFTFNIGAAAPVSPAAVPGTCYKVRPPLRWDRNVANDFVVVPTGGPPSTGHIKMPPADWMLPYNDQLWLPYARDEAIGSDFNSDSVFDTTNAQLKFKPGGNDWLVAAYPGPLTDEPGSIGPRILVLMRKSLFLVYLSATTLAIEAKKQIPGGEGIGCRARRTVQTCGEFVVWLSDQGVQLANLGRELALLTARRPLSADIQDLINRINWPHADRAVAAFHNNRYSLAVPLDASTLNNVVLVFNFLNTGADAPYGEWESVDVYPGDFDIVALLIMGHQGRQQLHAVTSLGGTYALEAADRDQYGAPGGALGNYEIEGIVLGRRLLFGSLETKQFIAVRVDMELEPGAQAKVEFSTVNPDRTRTLQIHTAPHQQDITLSRRPRQHGISGAVDIHLQSGRPIVKGVTVEAAGAKANTHNKE